jgi:hypothetical protein
MSHTLSGSHEPGELPSSSSCTDRKKVLRYEQTDLHGTLVLNLDEAEVRCYLPLMKSFMICIAFFEMLQSG